MDPELHELHELHELCAAYTLDALDESERHEFERHLADCRRCRDELAGFQDTAARLTEMTAQQPPAKVRAAVLGAIGDVRPLPPAAPTEEADKHPAPGKHLGRRRNAGWLLAAAVVVIALLTGTALILRPWNRPGEGAELASRVLAADDAQRFTVRVGDATTTIVRSVDLRRSVMVTQAMPAAPAGKTYQLWYFDAAGKPASAGLMPPGSDQSVLLTGDAATATGAGVTVEPAGGSPQPTTSPIVTFRFS